MQAACVGLLAWIPVMCYLGRGQEPWSGMLGWVALDVVELAALSTTARLLRRHDHRVVTAAAVTAALLLGDAAIDLLTSEPGAPRVMAAAMAVLVEVPLALLCCGVALRGASGGRAIARQPRAVMTIGSPSVMAMVCSTCAPREPSALRIVHPSGSKTIWSLEARNHGSIAMTRPGWSL